MVSGEGGTIVNWYDIPNSIVRDNKLPSTPLSMHYLYPNTYSIRGKGEHTSYTSSTAGMYYFISM